MKYLPRQLEVRAVQWDGSNAALSGVAAMTDVASFGKVLCLPKVGVAEQGDWVVQFPSGEVTLWNQRLFELTFEKDVQQELIDR